MTTPDPSPALRVTTNGPYLVSGGVPIKRRRIVYSEHGEPMTWQTKADLGSQPATVLCRCGGSKNKPFCDGTHQSNDFDGSETAPSSNYADRARTYPATNIVVRDDRAICEHAGFCGNRISNVWNMVKGSDTEDSVTRAQLMSMIERCPSGALTYRLSDDDDDIEPGVPVEIGVVDDGPYFVTGGIVIERADGEPFETRNRVTLCRCGNSKNKPLCDGTHKETGFKDG